MAQRPSMAKDLTPPSGTFSFFLLAFLLTLTGQGLVVAGLWRFLEAGASGLQTSVLTLVQALASILTPFLLQSWLETRPQMVLRLLAFGLGVAALLALGSPGLSTFLLLYAALLALFLFLTAALAIYGVLLGSALPRLFPKEALSQANARWEMANTLGLVLAPLIGGFAVDRLGPYALPLFALPLGVALVLLLGLKAPPPLGPSEGRRKAFGGVPLGVLLPVALPALLPALALTGGGVLTALLFHDLKRPEGLGIAWAGFSLGGFLVAQALTRVSLPRSLASSGGLASWAWATWGTASSLTPTSSSGLWSRGRGFPWPGSPSGPSSSGLPPGDPGGPLCLRQRPHPDGPGPGLPLGRGAWGPPGAQGGLRGLWERFPPGLPSLSPSPPPLPKGSLPSW